MISNNCIAKFKNNTKCTSESIHNFYDLLTKYDDVDEEFKNYVINNNAFCKIHIKTYIDHMVICKKVFNDNDLLNGKICSGCKINLPIECFDGFGSCIKCRSRDKKIKCNDKCVFNNCEFEQIKFKLKNMNDDLIQNTLSVNKLNKIYETYCGKHQLQGWLNELKLNNKKPCHQHNHYSCRVQLDINYQYSSCKSCLQMLSQKDRMTRNKLVFVNKQLNDPFDKPSNELSNEQLNKPSNEQLNKPSNELSNEQLNQQLNKPSNELSNEQLNQQLNKPSNDSFDKQLNDSFDKKYCTSCLKLLPMDNFIRNKMDITTSEIYILKHCIKCRIQGKKADDKRIDRIRDYSEYENRIEVKNRRREYRQKLKETNPRQYKLYTILFRERLREKLGEEKYLELMAGKMKKYLDKNPHMREKQNDKSKMSLKRLTYNYIRSASDRDINFELSDENAKELMKKVCFYCKDINEHGDKYFNGIDRLNNDIGYTDDNCVTCCKMCNMSKWSATLEEFIGRVYHIISYFGLIGEKHYYPEVFKNYYGRVYVRNKFNNYMRRSNKKQLKNSNFVFAVTREEFTIITSMDCYMCGKQSNESHNNGIDRINNKLGYISGNIMPCCGNCNYIKNEYDIYKLLVKFCQIYHKRLLTDDEKDQICDKIKIHLDKKIIEVNREINDNMNDVINMTFDMYIGRLTI
jgi:hypothetical protein